ncbi:hypothetical protein NDU88_004964 [Pleurodeles waltl]|uniref:Uncharacterized protein n=1 Tax=Pleurodeles waltl TaxID=8319 RepID=A0AAV7QJQ1_PLEWA|nr:hypothetical protein NDU88_004964 [Pleurodeles waltl]
MWRDLQGTSPTALRPHPDPRGSPQSRAGGQMSGGGAGARPRAVSSPPRASAQKANSSSTGFDVTLASPRGSLHRAMVQKC